LVISQALFHDCFELNLPFHPAQMLMYTQEHGLCYCCLYSRATQLIHDQLSEAPKYRGFFHGVTSIAKEHGISGCYKGTLVAVYLC